MNKYILAIDQGTTSSRALIINREGKTLGIAHRGFDQIFPQSGWVEHDAEKIWSSQNDALFAALAEAKLTLKDVAAIGITNQRETTVVWDKNTSQPIAPAIVWQDRRTAPLCQTLKDKGYEELFKKKTGLLLDPYFSGTKLKWILDNIPSAKTKARNGELAFGTIDSWLLWKLTDGKIHATDVTNASRTLLYNIHDLNWDEELLEILDIPRSLLPEVRSSSEVYGETCAKKFGHSIPIAGIAGDQQAALFGQACFEKGDAKITFGTGCFILANTGTKALSPRTGLITSIAYQIDNITTYTLEGSVFFGGAVVQWLRDNLHIIKSAADIEALASTVDDCGGVTFVPAFTGLGAPYWNPHARGMIMGISRGTTAGHIARATLEGIAFQVASVIKLMTEDIGINSLKVDGGASDNNLLMQIQSDLLQQNLRRPKQKELTALGVSFLAGLAIGYWKSREEIAQIWQQDRSFSPSITTSESLEKNKLWEKAVLCTQMWSEHEPR